MLDRASSIVVIGDKSAAVSEDGKGADVDFWVIRSLLNISKFLPEDSDTQISAEILNQKNVNQAEIAGAKEIICAEAFSSRVLAHSATKPGVLSVFEELLRTTDDTCEFYTKEIVLDHTENSPKTFKDISDPSGIAIGIMRRDDLGATPHLLPTADFKLESSDELIVLRREVEPKKNGIVTEVSEEPAETVETVEKTEAEVVPSLSASESLSQTKVDPNSASLEKLDSDLDLSPKIAEGIIELRGKQRFEKAEDLMKVDGIGPKTIERIKDKIFFTKED